jgi:signal transduction histidine kinase
MFIAAGLLANALADSAYLYAEATSGYVEGGAIDSFWLLGGFLLAFAAWNFPPKPKPIGLEGLRIMLVPCAFALAALVLLAMAALGLQNRLALGLAAATLFAVLVRMVLSFRENLRLIDATERASRAKSDFLANMSHELRTPLTVIIGYSEMMLGGVGMDDRDRVHWARRILSSGHHLQQLINDLLDLSKVEAGMMSFRPEEVDLHELMQEIAGTMRVVADNNRIELRCLIAAGLREVKTDKAKLKQVLYNYLSNAIKFTPPGGRVTLVLEPEGKERFRLTVEDTGIGIREEDQQRLFTEFHQVNPDAVGPHHGTGLGLALVKRIVEAQGGGVGVRSVPGRGSVFFAVLPGMARSGLQPAAVTEESHHPDQHRDHEAGDDPEGTDIALARHTYVHAPEARKEGQGQDDHAEGGQHAQDVVDPV